MARRRLRVGAGSERRLPLAAAGLPPPPLHSAPVTVAPTAAGERLESLDVLRGVALFGVLLENLQHFVEPSYEAFVLGPDGTALDAAVLWAIRFACDNKVYLLFSFLFGMGIALQMRRAEGAGARFATLHLWRMAILFLIGLGHLLVWNGDILTTYALLGLLMLPLRRVSDSGLRPFGLLGLLLPTLGVAGLTVFSGGRHATELIDLPMYSVRQSCFALAALTAGLAAGRRDALASPEAFVIRARPHLPWLLAVGVAANASAATLLMRVTQGQLGAGGIALEVCTALGAPSLAAVYVFAVMKGLTRPGPAARLHAFAPVGRTSLSNYLLQSAIGVGILARTGLGPLGPITPPLGVVLTIAIFYLQIVLSRWWLARFRFGPMEWLWRSATYGTLQPLRVGARAS